MQILRWQVGNSLKNYQYIVADAQKNAFLIDPLDLEEIEKVVVRENLRLKTILITHEHHDHAARAHEIQDKFSVPIYASTEAAPYITGSVTPTHDKAVIQNKTDLRAIVHKTPGHTAGHLAYEIGGFLFCGDALFHGGCGNCKSASANLDEQYKTINERLQLLSPDLIVMPGHYYAMRNLDFALFIEPENKRAHEMRSRIQSDADEMQHQSTLKLEREYNPFMRTPLRNIRARVAQLIEKDLSEISDSAVFKEIRTLRDSW
ncbi:MAG: Hydroxyacylglutathione hydrolase GloB [Turneriella sp.]|nr:Hydroxyacylglutathione hydrolase GloB [Turneriella sp.]